jgi:hypothetical protein
VVRLGRLPRLLYAATHLEVHRASKPRTDRAGVLRVVDVIIQDPNQPRATLVVPAPAQNVRAVTGGRAGSGGWRQRSKAPNRQTLQHVALELRSDSGANISPVFTTVWPSSLSGEPSRTRDAAGGDSDGTAAKSVAKGPTPSTYEPANSHVPFARAGRFDPDALARGARPAACWRLRYVTFSAVQRRV